MRLTSLIILLLASFSFSLKTLGQQGTLIITAIVKDGIIMEADSRSLIVETNGPLKTDLAFYDSVSKLYPFKSFMIGITGNSAIGDIYYSEIVKRFNTYFKKSSGLNQTFKEFITYLDKLYPIAKFPERKTNKYFAAGYENGVPHILSYDSTGIKEYTEGTIYSEPAAMKYVDQNIAKPVPVFDKIAGTILDYAEGEKQTHMVGGPISIVMIKPTGITWIRNNFNNKNFSSKKQFHEAIRAGRIKFHYLVPNAHRRILNSL